MRETPQSRASRRVVLVARIGFIWAAIVIGRLVHLQVIEHGALSRRARNQHEHVVPISANRGEIRDRTGQPFAISLRTKSVVVNPQRVPDPEFFANNIAPILNLDPKEVSSRLLYLRKLKKEQDLAKQNQTKAPESKPDPKAPSLQMMYVKRHITPAEEAGVKQQPFQFVEIVPDTMRKYPNGDLGVHVVGGVNAEGMGDVGIEARLNKELAGRQGKARVLTDSRQDAYYRWITDPGQQGADVTLTLHRLIQYAAEQELPKGIEQSGAYAGSIVVMDPESGEVLAMANYPGYSRDEEMTGKTMSRRSNLAVQAPCEPGSVMKMVTITMGLDTGRFKPESLIYCENGRFARPRRGFIHDVHPYGDLDVAGVLIKSSNIGVTKIALALGPEKLNEYQLKFGLGQKTGIELPGESRGSLAPQKRWSSFSHEYMSFGHELSATALQLARATAVIANGGLLVEPTVLLKKELPGDDGKPIEVLPVARKQATRVIPPETAFQVRQIMQRVVFEGTGKAAKIPGYTSGGKTGSAEMFDTELRQYRHDRHNASFIGFAPVTNPRVVVVVTLNGSRKLGGAVAAPLFARVAEAALRILQVPMDLPETAPEEPSTPEPVKPEPLLLAKAETPLPETTPLMPNELVGPRVPDFRGKPMAKVLKECMQRGLPLKYRGNGRALAQKPLPGEILPEGKNVWVEFGR